jgi:hypothetical protein
VAEKLIKAKEYQGLLARPGKHRDGAGLFLQVAAKGRASWVYQFRWDGETKWMSIGPAATFKLDEARDRHLELRRMRDRGIDPRSFGRIFQPYQPNSIMVPTAPAMDAAEKPASLLFGDVVAMFLAEFAATWTGGIDGKEADSYRRTLTGNSFARLPVAEIVTEHVEAALKPWADKPTTAEKVLMRIGKILNYATAKKLRTGENPARIKGHFEFLARPASWTAARLRCCASIRCGSLARVSCAVVIAGIVGYLRPRLHPSSATKSRKSFKSSAGASGASFGCQFGSARTLSSTGITGIAASSAAIFRSGRRIM